MFKKVAVIIIGLLLGGGIAYIFAGSPFFLLREIEISEPALVNKETLFKLGLGEGRNILLLKLEPVRERIKAIPEIKEAVIRKELPYKVTVEIEKYKPCAFLAENKNMAVSKDGVVFPFGEKERNGFNYPVIIYEQGGLTIGKPFPVLKKAIEAYLAVNSVGVPADVITIKRYGDIVLRMKETGTEIRMGEEDFNRRARYLEIVMKEIESKSVEYIDLRFGKDIVVKP